MTFGFGFDFNLEFQEEKEENGLPSERETVPTHSESREEKMEERDASQEQREREKEGGGERGEKEEDGKDDESLTERVISSLSFSFFRFHFLKRFLCAYFDLSLLLFCFGFTVNFPPFFPHFCFTPFLFPIQRTYTFDIFSLEWTWRESLKSQLGTIACRNPKKKNLFRRISIQLISKKCGENWIRSSRECVTTLTFWKRSQD